MDEYEQYFTRDRIQLQIIINHARGAAPDDWPPREEWKTLPHLIPWWHRFNDIKDAIDDGDLSATRCEPQAWTGSRVRPRELLEHFVARNGAEWDAIRETCKTISRMRGVLPISSPTPPSAETAADEYKVRVEQMRSSHGRPPNVIEDEEWRKARGIKRDELRDLRDLFLTSKEKRRRA